jgi:hypothetical protein
VTCKAVIRFTAVSDHLRRGFARFKAVAHLLQARSELFNLLLQFLYFTMFPEKFIKQHRVHCVVADGVWFSFFIAHYQARIGCFDDRVRVCQRSALRRTIAPSIPVLTPSGHTRTSLPDMISLKARFDFRPTNRFPPDSRRSL